MDAHGVARAEIGEVLSHLSLLEFFDYSVHGCDPWQTRPGGPAETIGNTHYSGFLPVCLPDCRLGLSRPGREPDLSNRADGGYNVFGGIVECWPSAWREQ